MKKRQKERIRSFIIKDSAAGERMLKSLMIVVFFAFAGIMAFYNTNYTGFAVQDANLDSVILSEERTTGILFNTFSITKNYGKGAEIHVESSIPVDVMVSEGTCSSAGSILSSLEGVRSKTINLKRSLVGDIDKLCLRTSASEGDMSLDVTNIQENSIKVIVKEK